MTSHKYIRQVFEDGVMIILDRGIICTQLH
ncbi:Uncharacterised protein [[Clostridium] sordellii]|nr:Uncharacterised protein [[Clostridium] sordellii] [Paeniclostridium sordellii]